MKVSRIGALFVVFHALLGCSDFSEPDKDEVITHLKSIDNANLSENARAILGRGEVIRVEHNSDEPVALATLQLGEDSASATTVTIVLVHTDDNWELYDKDLKDPNSSTSMLLRK